jgi:hypothetical protein
VFGLSIVSGNIVCMMRSGMRRTAVEEWVFTSRSSVSDLMGGGCWISMDLEKNRS